MGGLVDKKAVLRKYPSLIYDSGKDMFKGQLVLPDGDVYEIEISSLRQFPNSFPIVKEVGGRIPPKMDRHIYTDSCSCCFCPPAKEEILLKTRVKTLIDFIDLIVVPFFQNNSFYEINLSYAEGEYSHYFGILEGYCDLLNVSDYRVILRVLVHLSEGFLTLQPSSKCYCGSGKSLKKCSTHRKRYKKIRLLSRERVRADFFQIIEALNNAERVFWLNYFLPLVLNQSIKAKAAAIENPTALK